MTAAATDYRVNAIADGYVYECSCGELYNSVYAADTCRKCRNYCVFGYCTHVVDIRTGEVVAGEEPTAEAYAEAQKRAEAEWAAEQKSIDNWLQSVRNYEAHKQQQVVEQAEDIAYSIQDLSLIHI